MKDCRPAPDCSGMETRKGKMAERRTPRTANGKKKKGESAENSIFDGRIQLTSPANIVLNQVLVDNNHENWNARHQTRNRKQVRRDPRPRIRFRARIDNRQNVGIAGHHECQTPKNPNEDVENERGECDSPYRARDADGRCANVDPGWYCGYVGVVKEDGSEYRGDSGGDDGR